MSMHKVANRNVFQIAQFKADHHRLTRAKQGVRVAVHSDHIVKLVAAAQARGLVVPGLLNKLIEHIVNSPGMIDAIMDDGIKTPDHVQF